MRLLEKGKKCFENCNHAFDICHDFFVPLPFAALLLFISLYFLSRMLETELEEDNVFLSVLFNRTRGGF